MTVFSGQGLSKARRQEVEYAFRLFDKRRKGHLSFMELKQLLGAMGVPLNRHELSYLQMEEDVRGMFILEDVLAQCEAFYTDELIKERLLSSWKAHFDGRNTVSREELKELLCKQGQRLMIDPSEIDAFFNVYGDENNRQDVNVDKFIEMVLSE